MERTELPVAVFDSGLGGISVLRALVQRMPGEDFLYFGDSANAPYGVRPAAEVRELTQSVIARLYARGIKAAVIACNTATSAAIGHAARRFFGHPGHRYRAGAQARRGAAPARARAGDTADAAGGEIRGAHAALRRQRRDPAAAVS